MTTPDTDAVLLALSGRFGDPARAGDVLSSLDVGVGCWGRLVSLVDAPGDPLAVEALATALDSEGEAAAAAVLRWAREEAEQERTGFYQEVLSWMSEGAPFEDYWETRDWERHVSPEAVRAVGFRSWIGHCGDAVIGLWRTAGRLVVYRADVFTREQLRTQAAESVGRARAPGFAIVADSLEAFLWSRAMGG